MSVPNLYMIAYSFHQSPGSSLEVLGQIERLADGVLNKLAKSALLSYALEALRYKLCSLPSRHVGTF